MHLHRMMQAYTVSRVLMEKEACRFAQEHGIDLVTVCPVVTVGKAPAARKIPSSVPAFLSFISGTSTRRHSALGTRHSAYSVTLAMIDR